MQTVVTESYCFRAVEPKMKVDCTPTSATLYPYSPNATPTPCPLGPSPTTIARDRPIISVFKINRNLDLPALSPPPRHLPPARHG